MLAAALLLAAACDHTPLMTGGIRSEAVAQDRFATYHVHLEFPSPSMIVAIDKSELTERVVTTSELPISAIDLDGSRIYYGTEGRYICDPSRGCSNDTAATNELRVVTKSGGAPAVLLRGLRAILQIVHDEDFIYFVEAASVGAADGPLKRYEKRTGRVDTLLRGHAWRFPTDLIRNTPDALLTHGLVQGSLASAVVALPKSGAAPYVVARDGEFLDSAIDGNALYYRREEAIMRAPLTGGEAVRVATIRLTNPWFFIGIAGSHAYLVASGYDPVPVYDYDLCSGTLTPSATKSLEGTFVVDTCGTQPLRLPAVSALVAPPQMFRIESISPAAAKRRDFVTMRAFGVSPFARVTVGGVEAGWFPSGANEITIRIPADAPLGGVTIRIEQGDECAAAFFAITP